MYEVKRCSKIIKADTKHIRLQEIKDAHVLNFTFAQTKEIFSDKDNKALAGNSYILLYFFKLFIFLIDIDMVRLSLTPLP